MGKRKLVNVLVVLVMITLILPACSFVIPTDNGSTTAATTTGTTTATTTAPTTATTTQKPAPEKLTMFYHTSGNSVPDKLDFGNNEFINQIAEWANVEFTEVTVPAYADLKTKFNLMMASGNIPDIIHHNNIADMNQYGKDGAFLELSEIAKNSSEISKKYTQIMLDACKADDGNLYLLRSLPTDDGWHLLVRNDILKAAGVTSIPSTLDEWVDAMKKVKAKFPDNVIYTTMGMQNYMQFLFKPFGCENGWGWQYVGGKIINVFENPNLEAAVQFSKQLLADGLLDREFATTKQQDYIDKRWKNNTLLVSANLGSFSGSIDLLVKNNVEHVEFIPVKWPFVNKDSLDPYQVYVPADVVKGQAIAISARTKAKDGAVRVIETLMSDKVKDLFVYGREGIEYTVKDGKKVFDTVKVLETNWRTIYGMMFSYSPIERVEMKMDLSIDAMKETDSFKEAYRKDYVEAYYDLYNEYYGKISYAPVSVAGSAMNTLIPLSNESNALTKEAIAEQQSILLKAIMGEISMEEFKQQASALVKKYQSVTDEFNQKLPEFKAKYGVN